jgi:hypothetical protein
MDPAGVPSVPLPSVNKCWLRLETVTTVGAVRVTFTKSNGRRHVVTVERERGPKFTFTAGALADLQS